MLVKRQKRNATYVLGKRIGTDGRVGNGVGGTVGDGVFKLGAVGASVVVEVGVLGVLQEKHDGELGDVGALGTLGVLVEVNGDLVEPLEVGDLEGDFVGFLVGLRVGLRVGLGVAGVTGVRRRVTCSRVGTE